jgi:hypothetical protein
MIPYSTISLPFHLSHVASALLQLWDTSNESSITTTVSPSLKHYFITPLISYNSQMIYY